MDDSSGAPADEITLYEGEERVDTVTVGDTRLVVTTHRLLVRPEGDESARRAVDRTNLGAVQVRTQSTRGHIWSGIQWGLLSLFFFGAWQVVPFSSLVVPIEQPAESGLGGLFEAAQTLVGLLAFLDEAFVLAGVGAFVWSGVQFAQYASSRERTLEIEVTGADAVQLSVPESDAAVERLKELLATESGSEQGTPG